MNLEEAAKLAQQKYPFGYDPEEDGCDLLGYKSPTEVAFLIYHKEGFAAGNLGSYAAYLVNMETREVVMHGSSTFPDAIKDYVESPYNQQRLAQEAKQTG